MVEIKPPAQSRESRSISGPVENKGNGCLIAALAVLGVFLLALGACFFRGC